MEEIKRCPFCDKLRADNEKLIRQLRQSNIVMEEMFRAFDGTKTGMIKYIYDNNKQLLKESKQ